MTRRGGAALGLTLACGGCLFGPLDASIPEPSVCTNAPADARVEAAAVGSAPGAFTPLAADARTYVAEDESGDPWLAVRAGWRGPDVPACARVRIAIRDVETDAELAHRTESLTSVPQGPWRASDEVFFDASALPDRVVLVVEVYGAVAREVVQVGGFAAPDAGSN